MAGRLLGWWIRGNNNLISGFTVMVNQLRIICGKTVKDKMNYGKIREMTGVVRLEEFLREKRLRWLGHVERMD